MIRRRQKKRKLIINCILFINSLKATTKLNSIKYTDRHRSKIPSSWGPIGAKKHICSPYFCYWITTNQIGHLVKRESIKSFILFVLSFRKSKRGGLSCTSCRERVKCHIYMFWYLDKLRSRLPAKLYNKKRVVAKLYKDWR